MTKSRSKVRTDSFRSLKTAIFEILSYIEATEKDLSVYEEKNFDKRMEMIDFIEFQLVDRIEQLRQETDRPEKLNLLRDRAEKVKSELEQLNIGLFLKLQASIRSGEYTEDEFTSLIRDYFGFKFDYSRRKEEMGYDNLDIFINGLFSFQRMPKQTKDLEPEMVYYQKTPARIVFDQVEKTHITHEDVFFDLGSGLGQVAILVNLLAGIRSVGVEFEPAFCDYAGACASGLNLSNVVFINADAQRVDYSKGTIFYMFTPFQGEMLQEVLAILKKESLVRKIKIFTYGPCTAEVAAQSWLDMENPEDANIYKLGIFSSF
jgi:SAM-dependent methyltransferase